ncbi:solute carrier family 52, riboflavin transporter, member 3-B [Aplysia californica]|uniref:Riboflavin transporter n=1 Tax=Aplysia californica TaxID=6500 RepID=A0ABM1AEU2_APLCA|nr:solute carrier family 52, riboflavin transporter, member 3-B [Aplysia californica]
MKGVGQPVRGTEHRRVNVFTIDPDNMTSANGENKGRVQNESFPPGSVSRQETNGVKKMALRLRDSLGDTKLLVHVLVVVFAIASWIDLNGMWVELPLLVLTAPEQWKLPSYITVVSQVANIGPILFVLVSYLAPGTKPRLEKVTSFLVIVISMVAALLLAFLWQHRTYIGGVEHSTAMLALNFFLAVGDCTSSVSFYAFMAHMKPQYMPSLLLGEGLSGMLPAMIALGQGAGQIYCVNVTSDVNVTAANATFSTTPAAPSYHMEPRFTSARFPVRTYFIILTAIIACSGIAFLLLNFWKYCQSEFVSTSSKDYEYIVPGSDGQKVLSYGSIESGGGADNPAYVTTEEENVNTVRKSSKQAAEDANRNGNGIIFRLRRSLVVDNMSPFQFFIHQITLVLINMTFTTFLSTIQVYSTLPYGLRVYHLATTLVQIANPVACFFAVFLLVRSQVFIVFCTLLGQVCVAYIIYLASMSPEPPMIAETAGGNITLTVWVLATLFLIYAKVCVAGVLRESGRTALIWAGISTQVGSLIGAIVGFLLVNEYQVFQQANYC